MTIKKHINSLPDYEIYEDGRVYSIKRSKFLKVGFNAKGYIKVNLCVNGIKMTKLIHRLLAEAFIDNPLNKPQVNHINGVKTDNKLKNLEWCTNSENQSHAYNNSLKKVTLKQSEAGRRNLKNWHSKQKVLSSTAKLYKGKL